MSNVTPKQLARYLAGDLPPEESDRVLAWLKAHPEVRADLEGFPARASPDVDAHLARIAASAARRPGDRIRRSSGELRRRALRSGRWKSVAAAAAVVFVTAVVALVALRQPIADRTYSARAGARNSFTLDDGSEVVLNAASRLTVSGKFGERRRIVTLDGEAYFDITTDTDRPFTIQTSEATVTVLGTAFNVDAYAGEPLAVVVAEGRVRLQNNLGSVVDLSRGERGRLLPGTGRIVTDRVSIEDAVAWKEGRLVFRGAPLANVSRRLERQYGVNIEIEAGLESKKLDASFDGRRIEQIAELIAVALELDVHVEGETVTFSTSEGTP